MLRITFSLVLAFSTIIVWAHRSAAEGAVPPREYVAALMARIEKFKRYPKDGSLGGGGVVVRFTLDSQGQLSKPKIVKSSGVPGYDRAALDMLEQAAPFPPPPPGHQYEFTLPVNFNAFPVQPGMMPASQYPGWRDSEEREKTLGLRSRPSQR